MPCTTIASDALLNLTWPAPRLLLQLAQPELAQGVADYYRRNWDFLAPFEPTRPPDFFTLEGQRALLVAEAQQAAEDRGYRFYLALREQPAQIIGLVGLNNLVRGAFQSCFLSYKLDGAHLRQGYATEAVAAATALGFDRLGLHRIEANIMPRNRASLRVAEKAGYENEGLAKQYLKIGDVWEDHIHMVRLQTAPYTP